MAAPRTPLTTSSMLACTTYQDPCPTSLARKEDDKKKYFDYYKSLTAIQSFNNYILTRMKSDYEVEGDPRTNSLRNQLVRVASARNFQEEIASKSSGKIMRWLLLFTAQNYVLNTQIQQSLRQLVIAQAMNNSLMILFNTPNENQLIRNAKGLPLASSGNNMSILDLDAAHQFWHNYDDPMIYRVIAFMETAELWTWMAIQHWNEPLLKLAMNWKNSPL